MRTQYQHHKYIKSFAKAENLGMADKENHVATWKFIKKLSKGRMLTKERKSSGKDWQKKECACTIKRFS